jgi:hypothetical protein
MLDTHGNMVVGNDDENCNDDARQHTQDLRVLNMLWGSVSKAQRLQGAIADSELATNFDT